HYFTLLLVVVSIAQPRLGAAWLAPLGMLVATGSGNPTAFQTAATICAAALTVGLCLLAVTGMSLRPVRLRPQLDEAASRLMVTGGQGSAASTSSACSAGFTFLITFTTFPSASMTKVERSTPMYVFP